MVILVRIRACLNSVRIITFGDPGTNKCARTSGSASSSRRAWTLPAIVSSKHVVILVRNQGLSPLEKDNIGNPGRRQRVSWACLLLLGPHALARHHLFEPALAALADGLPNAASTAQLQSLFPQNHLRESLITTTVQKQQQPDGGHSALAYACS